MGMLNIRIRIRILSVFLPPLFARWRFSRLKAGSHLPERVQIE